jgi:hypothetical protein
MAGAPTPPPAEEKGVSVPHYKRGTLKEYREHLKAHPEEKKAKEAPVDPTGGRILIFKNKDKQHAGKSGRAPWLPEWPYRMLISGPVHSGKTNVAINIVTRMHPSPDKILILHLDPASHEYAPLELVCECHYYTPDMPPALDEFPEPGSKERCVLIVDEVATKTLPKQARSDIERLCNYGSSHRNTSIIFVFQNLTGIEPSIRRAFQHFVIFPSPDEGTVDLAAHRVGCPVDMLKEIMTMCHKKGDSIYVDTTQHPDAPYRFRLNLANPIYRVLPD